MNDNDRGVQHSSELTCDDNSEWVKVRVGIGADGDIDSKSKFPCGTVQVLDGTFSHETLGDRGSGKGFGTECGCGDSFISMEEVVEGCSDGVVVTGDETGLGSCKGSLGMMKESVAGGIVSVCGRVGATDTKGIVNGAVTVTDNEATMIA